MNQLSSSTASRVVSLTNRIGHSVDFKVCRREHEDRQYLFIEPLGTWGDSHTRKNANYFAVQLAQGLQLQPRAMQIIELRPGAQDTQVWRWRLKLAEDTIVDTVPEPVANGRYQNFLLDLKAG